jgi:hypothetical protein
VSKFLNLIEQFDPQNTEDPKWKLIDFLKSKGIHVELVRDTDMLYIHTDGDVIAVNVSIPEEEAESINASTGTYEVDKAVDELSQKPMLKLGNNSAVSIFKAKRAKKERDQLAGQAVDAYKKGTDRIKKGLQAVKQSAISRTY